MHVFYFCIFTIGNVGHQNVVVFPATYVLQAVLSSYSVSQKKQLPLKLFVIFSLTVNLCS